MAQLTSTLQAQPAPRPATVFSMATACAFAVATIYYSQPLLPQIFTDPVSHNRYLRLSAAPSMTPRSSSRSRT